MPLKAPVTSRSRLVHSIRTAALSLALCVAAAHAAHAQSTRFGDSTWVAPAPYSSEHGSPADPGPRVAGRDHERRWETALRTPFRVVFLPFRLITLGLEGAADFAEAHFPLDEWSHAGSAGGPPKRGVSIAPQVSLSATEGFGAGASIKKPLGDPGSVLRTDFIWTTRDTRRARLRAVLGDGTRDVGASAFALYDHRPNRRFYGIGNSAGTTRTIFFGREDRLDGSLFYGRNPFRRVSGIIGLSDFDIGPGYNDTPRAIDVFGPNAAPYLDRGSRVWSVGVGGAFATIDRPHDPASGIHLFGEARHVMSADGNDITYESYRAEGRGYVPVFSARRIVALRGVFEGVNPESGSGPIPFYRLPSSVHDDRFDGYSSDRFRDHRLTILQGEYRWLIWSNLWAFGLAQRAEVAPSTGALRWTAMHEAYGGGLRYQLSNDQTARFEVAKGTQGIDIDLNLDASF
jgi:hypothetical protein